MYPKSGSFAVVKFLLATLLLALASTNASANCCNIITTQSCANCNFFMCNCDNPCDCEDSCASRCDQEYNTCLIYCTQRNCNYCTTYYHACMRRCPAADVAVESVQEATEGKTKSCEVIYSAIDENGDKRISKKELVAFITTHRDRLSETPLTDSPIDIALESVGGKDPEVIFKELDKNADGEIDRSEAGLP